MVERVHAFIFGSPLLLELFISHVQAQDEQTVRELIAVATHGELLFISPAQAQNKRRELEAIVDATHVELPAPCAT